MIDHDLGELIGPCGEVKRHKRLLLWRARLAQLVETGPKTLTSGHEIMMGTNNEVRIMEAITPAENNGAVSSRMMILRGSGTLDIWGETQQNNPLRVRTTWGRRVNPSVSTLDEFMIAGIATLHTITKRLSEER